MTLLTVGANHRTAPVDLRERLHLSGGERGRLLARSLDAPTVDECVLLSTCNRTELYLVADRPGEGGAFAEEALARAGATAPGHLEDALYRLTGPEAARHLYRVTAGLDSLALGEPQIQGQVRDAYESIHESQPEAIGPILHRLFQSALGIGGRIRAETGLGEGSHSVLAAAACLIEKVLGTVEGRETLVLGAGEMGQLVLRSLVARGAGPAWVASRTAERAREAGERVDARAVGMDAAVEMVPRIDVLVTATAATGRILERQTLEAMRGRNSRRLVVVDLAVPRDVDPAVGDLPRLFHYDLDDLAEVVRRDRENRDSARTAAARCVEREVGEFWRWYRGRRAVPVIRRLRSRAERIRREEVDSTLSELDGFSEEDRSVVRRATRLTLRKLLHEPTVRLRRLAQDREVDERLELARRLLLPAEQEAAAVSRPADDTGDTEERALPAPELDAEDDSFPPRDGGEPSYGHRPEDPVARSA